VIGIDEDTAIVDMAGGGRSWQVHGQQQAWLLDGSREGGDGSREGGAGSGDGGGGSGDGGGDGGAGRPFPAGAAITI
jgi:hypothetical protein